MILSTFLGRKECVMCSGLDLFCVLVCKACVVRIRLRQVAQERWRSPHRQCTGEFITFCYICYLVDVPFFLYNYLMLTYHITKLLRV